MKVIHSALPLLQLSASCVTKWFIRLFSTFPYKCIHYRFVLYVNQLMKSNYINYANNRFHINDDILQACHQEIIPNHWQYAYHWDLLSPIHILPCYLLCQKNI